MQSFYSKNTGFTLFELMITMAIVALLYTIAMSFTQNPAIYREKTIRMQSYIEDSLKSARTNTMIGKGPRILNNQILLVQKREVLVSSGNIQTIYYTGTTNTGSEKQIQFPFFDSDKKYTVTNISGNCISGTPSTFTGLTQAVVTYEQNKDITISRTLPISPICVGSSVRNISFQVQYNQYTASVTLDRVTGIVTISNPTTN